MAKGHESASRVRQIGVGSLAALALLVSGYKLGEAHQSGDQVSHPAPLVRDPAHEIASKISGDEESLKEFRWLREQNGEDLEKLDEEELFNSAVRLQKSVMDLSDKVGMTDFQVLKASVPELKKIHRTYKDHNIHFLFVRPDPDDPNSLSPHVQLDGDGDILGAFIPFVAGPHNHHPDHLVLPPRTPGSIT